MSPTDPRHGSYAGAQAHIKAGVPLCDPCTLARRKYQKRLTVDHNRGKKRRIDPAIAAKHVGMLIEKHGVTRDWIAEQAGVHHHTVTRLLDAARNGRLAEISTVRAVLTVRPPSKTQTANGYMPREIVVRKILALNTIGWTRREIARRLGMSGANLTTLVSGKRAGRRCEWVNASTWHKVDDLYRELHMTPGPSEVSRKYAREQGWLPPLAWDDINDPDEKPVLAMEVKIGRGLPWCELLAEWDYFRSVGMTEQHALETLGVTADALRNAEKKRAKAETESAA